MRSTLFVLCSAFLLVACATGSPDADGKASQAKTEIEGVPCSDIEYGEAVTSQFPEVARACQAVVRDASGTPLVKVNAKVHHVRRNPRDQSVSRVTLDLLDTQGESLRMLTVNPPRDFRFTIDGEEKSSKYLTRGQDLRVYLPSDRWEVAWNIDNATPIDTLVFVEDMDTVLVTSSLKADEAFEFDSAELSDVGRAELQAIVDISGGYVPAITVFGYTDYLGEDDYNLDLSQRRADAARDYLIAQGVPAGRVSAIGRGESNPIVTCGGKSGEGLKACLAPNRRAEVVLIVPAVADLAAVEVTKTYRKPLGEIVQVTEQLGVAQLEDVSGQAGDLLDQCATEIEAYCGKAVAGDGRILGCLAANLKAGYDYSDSCNGALGTFVDAVAFRRARFNAVGLSCSTEIAACDAVPFGEKLECVAMRPQSDSCRAAMALLSSAAF